MVIAEMVHRQFLFAGDTDLETLSKIIDVCGTTVAFPPPEWDHLPDVQALGVRTGNLPNQFAQLFPRYCPFLLIESANIYRVLCD